MSINEQHSYDVKITWKEGRRGRMQSSVLNDVIDVATPPEFPGGVEGVWSPEHLFTASVSSCFLSSFLAISEYSKLDFDDIVVNSEGIMSKTDGKFIMSKIILQPVLTISDAKFEAKAYRLLEKAEQICLITRSIKSEIVFEPKVHVLAKESAIV